MIRRRLAGLALAGGLAAAIVAAGPPPPTELEPVAAKQPVGEGACDATGVTVSYRVAYDATTPGYRTTHVTVGDIDSHCDDAVLHLVLQGDGPDPLGELSYDLGPDDTPTATVEMSVIAADLVGVHVDLVGGELPIPPECNGLTLDQVVWLTLGGDDHPAVNHGTALFGLSGNDVLRGGNNGDCVDAGSGDDAVTGGNGNDVLIGGPGADRLDGGNGTADVCITDASDPAPVNCEQAKKAKK